MNIEVVWVDDNGCFSVTKLEYVTDVQVLEGVTIFFEGNMMLLGVATNKLVFFKKI